MIVDVGLRASDTLVPGSPEAFLHSVVEALDARWGVTALWNGDEGTLCQGPSYGPFPSFPSGLALAHWVAARREPLALKSPGQARQTLGLAIESADLFPLLGVPILKGDQVLGTLLVRVPSWADDKELHQKLYLLDAAATALGYILENERLREELQKKEAYVMRLVKAIIEAQEAERERICLEVHDGVTQTLVSAFQYLQALQNILPAQETQVKHMVNRTATLIRQAVQESREVINSLAPAPLADLGLVRTLREELRQFEKETECKVEFEGDWPRLAPDMEIALYRILREAVTNIRKHAKAQRMRLQLSCLPDGLVALIRDWGVGFDPGRQEPFPSKHGAGLFSMRKRAELLGGTCEIHSAPGQGTEIRVEVPVIE